MEPLQLSSSALSFSSSNSKSNLTRSCCNLVVARSNLLSSCREIKRERGGNGGWVFRVWSSNMLAPRKFMRPRRKMEVFKDEADEVKQRSWRKMMREIEESGGGGSSVVSVLRRRRIKGEDLSRGMVLGTVLRFKQMKKWGTVIEILEWLRDQYWWEFTDLDLSLLLTAYGKQGLFNKAEEVLKYMTDNNFPPSEIAYTAVMEAYGKASHYTKAEAIFRRMQLSGPKPSVMTYQIILNIFVEGQKFAEAQSIFDGLLNANESSLKLDQRMFHTMIYMYKKWGKYDEARKLLSVMTERGLPQSTVTFNSLMSFEKNYKEVSKIYDQMQRAGCKPDVTSYTLLINAYGKARREEEALAVFEEMLDARVRPTSKAYNTLLNAFAISGMVDGARTLFKRMTSDRCGPDLYSYTTMLSAYVNASDMKGAEKFFLRFKHDGVSPNVVTYGVLLKGYANNDDLKKMTIIYKEMRMQGIKPNQIIFTTLMDAHSRNSDFGNAVLWYKEMEANGYKADQKAKNVLLSLAKTHEELNEAKELVGHILLSRDRIEQSNAAASDHYVVHAYDDDDDDDDDDDSDSDSDEVDIYNITL